MKLFCDDTSYDFSEEELESMYVDEGEEGIIYRYGDKAFKVYKPYCYKTRMKEDTCQQFLQTRIPTKRVLLPQSLLRSEDYSFIGYTTPFIVGGPPRVLLSLKVPDFMNKIDEVYDDLYLLADHHVLVYDLIYSNSCYDGKNGLYFVDPGSYEFDSKRSFYRLLSINRQSFTDYLIEDIFRTVLSSRQASDLCEHFMGADYLPDIMKDEADPNETVRKYVKRITS